MRRVHLALLLLIVVVGCEMAGSSDSSMRCSSDVRRGSCTITYAYIESTEASRDIEDKDWWPQSNAVEVSSRVTVGTGAVRVWFKTPAGETVEATAVAGEPATLVGTAWMQHTNDTQAITLYFEPLGQGKHKRAEQITAEVDYDMP